MKKKIFLEAILFVLILVCIFLIPRHNTAEKFSKLKYGDSFVITMLKVGKPSHVSEGGIGLLHFGYELDDDSTVYLTFGKHLIWLETCIRFKDNKVINRYVTKIDKLIE